MPGIGQHVAVAEEALEPTLDLSPATRNPAFSLDRPLTDAQGAAKSNNFYEIPWFSIG